MHLERLNDALAFLKRPRVQELPLQISSLKSVFELPIWSRTKFHRAELESLEDSVCYNPAFKLPSLEQLSRLYYHTIYESVIGKKFSVSSLNYV